MYTEYRFESNDTYQDVQGTLWAIFELSDGGKDWEYETGEDQEEAGRDREKHSFIFKVCDC